MLNSGRAAKDSIGGQQKPHGGSHGVPKAVLSRAGDVASQREAGFGIQRLGKSVNELFQGAQVLALAVAEIHHTQAGKRKGVFS